MDTLSVELHAQIFEYACLDDGSTARALALVSHYIHDVAQPFLYQSLAVQGFIQMHALIATLTPLPHYLRRIRYLYLSDSSPSAWHHAPFESPGRIPSDADMARYEEAQAAAAHLLLLAAPTLEMLAVTADCLFMGTALIAHLFALQLPHLRELAVRGFYPFLAGTDGPSMPRLERLHLEGNRSPYGLLDCGGMKETCPALEHLAISGVVAAHGFANEVEAVVCRSEGDMEGPRDADSPLPRGLRRIVIRPGSVLHAQNAGIRIHQRQAKMTDLLERAAKSSAGKLVIRRPPSEVPEKTGAEAGRMYELWRDRVGGGKGWWEDA